MIDGYRSVGAAFLNLLTDWQYSYNKPNFDLLFETVIVKQQSYVSHSTYDFPHYLWWTYMPDGVLFYGDEPVDEGRYDATTLLGDGDWDFIIGQDHYSLLRHGISYGQKILCAVQTHTEQLDQYVRMTSTGSEIMCVLPASNINPPCPISVSRPTFSGAHIQ